MGGRRKFIGASDMKLGLIGDEETVTGMVLAGMGHVDGQGRKNFLIVTEKSTVPETSSFFKSLTERKDIAMILVTQSVASDIAVAMTEYAETGQVVPTVMNIPSKEQAYDPRNDPVMQRVKTFLPNAFQAFG